MFNYQKYGIMVKRKEVKIDEEQIRRVMAGDIPASVLENRYGSNAADSQKEDDKKPETENRSGIPAKSDKVEVPGVPVCPAVRKKRRLRFSGRKHTGKRTVFRSIPNICSATTL